MNTFFTALIAACLIYDAKSQTEYAVQLKLKDFILEQYTYEELAEAYYLEFGDFGDTLESILRGLKRL